MEGHRWNGNSLYVAFVIWTLALCVYRHGDVDAATTHGRPASVSQSARKNRVMEPAFQNAGRAPGLKFGEWKLSPLTPITLKRMDGSNLGTYFQNFRPVAYPKNEYGKFYSGDSYVLLFTKENRGVKSWNIHFWLGQQTSQDESGAAAILAVALDDQLGGDPVQYREVQDHESELFLSYFKNGVRYLPGGVSSGFTHVDRDAFEKRLFHIKGKRNIRVKQVDLTVASMNKGDCFILDTGREIFVYVGTKSKNVERLKAISAANQIRDQDHSGRGRVNVIDQFSSEADVQSFFTALGSGSPQDVPDESAGGDDEAFETTQERAVTLYRVSDGAGRLKIEPVSQKPLRQNLLDANDCFILDTGDANIFVWIGKKCNKNEKSQAMSKGQEFLTSKKYPGWTHVERIVDGAEPTIFRQYFQTWQGAGETHTRLIRSAAPVSKLQQKSSGEIPEFMPDEGDGSLEIFRVEDMELVSIDPDNYGNFFGGDSYVIKYHATNGAEIIYIWQGGASSIDEKAASAIHAVRLDREVGGRATQIRVAQDNEPKHFLRVFKGKLIIFLGGHASGFKNIREHDTYVEGETRLFRVRGTSELDTRASQQLPVAGSLQSDDVFIVENGNTAWIWQGKNCDQIEKELASNFLDILAPNTETVVVQEGEEPDDFWEALGGKTDYQESYESADAGEPRLFHLHLLSNGRLKVEEIHDFEQEDLAVDDVMVLDTGSEVYVWIGSAASEDEKSESFKNVSQYLKKANRENAIVLTISHQMEPEHFISNFPRWDPDFWSNAPSYDDVKLKLLEQNDLED